MKYITPLLTLLFVAGLAPASAQKAPAEKASTLHLIARPYGDSITLRWAPTDYSVWREMQLNGVVLERRIAGDTTWVSVTADRLIAFSVEDFRAFSDTTDVHVVAVAEALHGTASLPETGPGGPMGEARQALDEQEQRFFLAAVNADLSAPAAHALGWRWTDQWLTPGRLYEYRVRTAPAPGMTASRFVSKPLHLRSNDNFPYGPVFGLDVQEAERKVTLSWHLDPNRKRFVAYHVEVSDDGRNFRRMQEYPLFKTLPREGEDVFTHEIELEENYRPRHYRLVGINSFGETVPPSESVVGQGVDENPPPPLHSLGATDNGAGGFRIQWDFPEATPPDVRGYVVVRSQEHSGPYMPVNEALLDPLTTEFTDPEPIPYRGNYYAVYTYDTSGNYARSTPVLAVWKDNIAPAQPTGLRGRIDTLGNVFLMWETGKEPDLHGYRVYVSHAKNREFLQVTHEILHQNYFFDSTRLMVLNEVIYYKIVAVDHNFNPSAYSEILELKRPDRIAPSAPLIQGFSAVGEGVTLRWQRSNSPDVLRQEIWRSSPEETWRPLRALPPGDSTFRDTTTLARHAYTYRIRALDEANLYADSRPLALRSGTVAAPPGVTDLARTQVPGTDKEELRWKVPVDRVAGFQLFRQTTANSPLRTDRRLDAAARSWPIPPAATANAFAIQVIYTDGSRSPLSAVAVASKK